MQLQREVVAPLSLRRALAPPVLGLLLIVGVALHPRFHRWRGMTSEDIATLAVKDYAFDAFSMWRADHPEHTCPASLDELSPYIGSHDTRDPWGNPYRFACEHGSLWVGSSGMDGRIGTDDDLASDR